MKALTNTATIYAVAERAGVSIATVSRALRGSSLVTQATRERVEQAARELNFRPSRSARSLAEGRNAANGIVFPDLSGPYYAEVVLGYEEAAAELGRSVLILATRGRVNADDQVRDLAGRVDGLVVMGQTIGDDAVREIAATGLPVVLLARPRIDDLATIAAESHRAATELTDHLIAHGHRRFAFLGDPDASYDVAERWNGMREALASKQIAPPAEPVRCGFDEVAGEAAADRALRNDTRPDVLVCANDEIALGALLAAERRGLAVPDELAVTGWDDIMAARHVRPALTTMRQPMRELGAHAARALDARIEGGSAPALDVLPTALTVRSSCGPHHEEDTHALEAPRSGSARTTSPARRSRSTGDR
jgi:LacI family transcriptional regulator